MGLLQKEMARFVRINQSNFSKVEQGTWRCDGELLSVDVKKLRNWENNRNLLDSELIWKTYQDLKNAYQYMLENTIDLFIIDIILILTEIEKLKSFLFFYQGFMQE